MIVLVDTPIWSVAYRRRKLNRRERHIFREWKGLVEQQRAVLIGPVRQEVLCGFSATKRYELLRTTLRAFEDVATDIADYELVAKFYNDCRRKGIQGSLTDFLICAVAARLDVPVFTTDRNFRRYAKVVGIKLYRR